MQQARNWWWLHLNIKLWKSMEILCITELSICCLPSTLTLFWNAGSVTSTHCSQPQIAIYEPVPKTKIYPMLCLWCILILYKLDGMVFVLQQSKRAKLLPVGFLGWRVAGFWRNTVSELSVINTGPFSLDSENNCFHWKNNGKNTHLRKKVTWEGVWGMRNPFLTTW